MEIVKKYILVSLKLYLLGKKCKKFTGTWVPTCTYPTVEIFNLILRKKETLLDILFLYLFLKEMVV